MTTATLMQAATMMVTPAGQEELPIDIP